MARNGLCGPRLSAVRRPLSAVQALNINADTAAGEIAAALGAEKLILMTGGLSPPRCVRSHTLRRRCRRPSHVLRQT